MVILIVGPDCARVSYFPGPENVNNNTQETGKMNSMRVEIRIGLKATLTGPLSFETDIPIYSVQVKIINVIEK